MIDLTQASHANVIYGELDTALATLAEAMYQQWGVSVRGNPDYLVYQQETLAVDDARTVQDQVYRTPAVDTRICIIAFTFAGTEAQNALLKVLEEPPARTRLFVIARDEQQLLPTVRSRLTSLGSVAAVADDAAAHDFLAADPAQRLQQVAPIIKAKDKQRALALLESLERVAADNVSGRQRDAQWRAGMQAIQTAREYLNDRAPSVKMLLEYVALTVPQRST